MSFLIFLVLLIKLEFRIPRYLKLLYFSVPKLSGSDTFIFLYKKTEPNFIFGEPVLIDTDKFKWS